MLLVTHHVTHAIKSIIVPSSAVSLLWNMFKKEEGKTRYPDRRRTSVWALVLSDGEECKKGAGTRVEYKVPSRTLPEWAKRSTRVLRQEKPKRADGKVECKKVPRKRVRRDDSNKGTTDTISAKAPLPRPLKDMEEEIGRKLITGIPRTPEEQLRREQDLVHRRANNEKYRRKDRIAKGRDTEPAKIDNPGSFKKAPLFSWQLAEQDSSSASSK
ncbi:hypothetical protein RvY_00437 [Ramazzottius varieornatus]|uniref:Uncharacterized protein n=1 Tax=Ramazzottius varieornatus TaxID=947166 RepID=A0A1D1UN79_RAMVA|nr:hypothetical protein RvY_00437 [Ramazzottius varieornatus]